MNCSDMMVLSALRPDASIFEFLAHRARAASVRRLVADALTGAATIVAGIIGRGGCGMHSRRPLRLWRMGYS